MTGLPVEDTFRKFVCEFGGELVSNLLPSGNAPSNADFLFRKRGVIAELKCLENNSLGENYPAKMKALAESWMLRGLLIAFGAVNIELQKLRPECQREWLDLISEPFQGNIIKKADRQIRETKKWLDMPDAKGLLFVASDGNLAMQPYDVGFFVTRILAKKKPDGAAQYSSIDGFFYFSLNQFAKAPESKAPVFFTHAGPRHSNDVETGRFCSELQDAWYKYLCRLNGAPVPIIPSSPNTIQQLKWV
jgi:hypothetical protein